jgi:hypothetical protein
MDKEKMKSELLQKLHDNHVFWSYSKDSCQTISDWNLIKFVLIHLDLDDIDLLFQMYSKRKIKTIWLKELVTQGDYLKNMNLCFATVYFDVKRPVQYLKAMETYQINRKCKNHIITNILAHNHVEFQIDAGVKLSFYAPEKIAPQIEPVPYLNNLKLVSESTIAALKMETLMRRNYFRDYYDLYFILKEKSPQEIVSIIDNALKYSHHTLKSKNLLGMLTNYEQFSPDAGFQNLEPILNISPQEIAEFMSQTVKLAYQNRYMAK